MHALIVAVVPPFPGKDHVALGVEFRAPAVALAVLPHAGIYQISLGVQKPDAILDKQYIFPKSFGKYYYFCKVLR